MKRDIITLWDLSSAEIDSLIRRAIELKSGKDAGLCPLIGKSVGLLFEKPSTRTRVSFEVGIYQLGGHAVILNPAELQLGRGESLPDTAKTLSRYLDGMVLRTYAHSTVEQFAAHALMPVINGLSDHHHPCQILGDLMTVLEKKGRVKGLKVAYIGDGNNVCNSLIEAASRMSFDLAVACPEGFEPDASVLKQAISIAEGKIAIMRDPMDAAAGADAVYTDVWVSMGQEDRTAEKKEKFAGYQINQRLMSVAGPDAIALHCLPAYRGLEITDEVMDGPQSAVFDQAENRLHAQKALVEMLLR